MTLLEHPVAAQETVNPAATQEKEPTKPEFEIGETSQAGDARQQYIDGVKALNAGDFQTAQSLLEKTVQAQPRNVQVRFALAMACLKNDKTGKAWFHLRRVVLLNPRHQRAVRHFLSFWQTIERRGGVNVGQRAEEVRAVAGQPDRG